MYSHIYFFSLHCIVLFPLSEHQQVDGVQSAHGGFLRYEGIGQIQNWYGILKEENLGFHLNIYLSAILKNFSNYAQVYSHISFFSLHCIVLFPLRAPASWWSAKCTRRLFKVWRNWPNSKLIYYSERGEPMLLFATLENVKKIIPNRSFIFLFFFFTLYCIFSFCKTEEPFLKTSQIISKCTVIFLVVLNTVLYCFHWEHQQVDGVQSAHGGSLRYEEIGKIQNWYVILKQEKLGFHLNIHLSAILKNFSNYIQVYSHIYCCFFTLYCIVSTGSTSKLMECKVHTEAF